MYCLPEGELLIFNNPDEVKDLFISLGLDPYQLEMLDISVNDADNVPYTECTLLPVFEGRYAIKGEYRHMYKRDDLTLDPRTYSKYPLVMYLNIGVVEDRVATTDVFLAIAKPLSEIHTVDSLKNLAALKREEWIKRTERSIRLEELREL